MIENILCMKGYKMAKTIIDDGFASYLVEGAEFDGPWEIPIIKKEEVQIPKDILPYEKRMKVNLEEIKNTGIHFYMHDIKFRSIIAKPSKYIDELNRYAGIISPDCSLYIDMPLCLQMTNTYINRAVGYYMQKNGISVIPNIRWGDERSFEFSYAGVEKYGTYSISTLGCIRSREEKEMFKKGLEEMLIRLEPQTVLVHGVMPKCVFEEYEKEIKFIHYESWTARVKKGALIGNK